MPTKVEVYRVESDNSTGPFLGFGSLLDPALVFIHPAASPPDPGQSEPGPSEPGPIRPGPSRPGPSRPGPSRPGPSRPGPFRPDFPTRPRVAQPLHDEVGHPGDEQPVMVDEAEVPGARPGRARCRIRSGHSVLTLDGDLLPAPTRVRAPRSIQLDVSFAGEISYVSVPQGPGHPTAEEAADAVVAFVTEAARSDPAAPIDPPPEGPDVQSGQHPHPGRRPWYCVICPGAFGC